MAGHWRYRTNKSYIRNKVTYSGRHNYLVKSMEWKHASSLLLLLIGKYLSNRWGKVNLVMCPLPTKPVQDPLSKLGSEDRLFHSPHLDAWPEELTIFVRVNFTLSSLLEKFLLSRCIQRVHAIKRMAWQGWLERGQEIALEWYYNTSKEWGDLCNEGSSSVLPPEFTTDILPAMPFCQVTDPNYVITRHVYGDCNKVIM